MTVPVQSNIYTKSNFKNTIDTDFRQLISISADIVIIEPTVADIFQNYNDLFYSIPKEGEQSHRYILEKSAEYLGVNLSTNSVQELLEEITTLNQQLLTTTKELELIKNVTISQ